MDKLISILWDTLALVVACGLGLLFGLRSYVKGKPAGLKTHSLVSGAACLVMLCGRYMAKELGGIDPTRMAGQVISGIGFIGAGTIIKDSFGAKGITTAASIWAVACIGLACGAGYYAGALICSAILFAVMSLSNLIENKLSRKNRNARKKIADEQQILDDIALEMALSAPKGDDEPDKIIMHEED